MPKGQSSTRVPPGSASQSTLDLAGAGESELPLFAQLAAAAASASEAPAIDASETSTVEAEPPAPKHWTVTELTTPSGAAIQDMLNILRRRAPHLRVTIIPALVQGDGAHAQLIRGLECANRAALGDVVVLARGGGSIEDLWCFNHEELARAIAA